MKDTIIAGSVLAYLISGSLAFGHAASRKKAEDRPFSPAAEQKAFHGFIAALANPLYWSWAAFERHDPALENPQ